MILPATFRGEITHQKNSACCQVLTQNSVDDGQPDEDAKCDDENLNQNLLEEESSPSGEKDDSDLSSKDLPPWSRTTNTEESGGTNDESKEDENRMIDLPFGLFDD